MWRPGNPAPHQKQKQKSKKRRNAVDTSDELQLKKFLEKQNAPKKSKNKRVECQAEEDVIDLDEEKGASLALANAKSSPKSELSTTLKSMHFMVRRNEAKELARLEAEKLKKAAESRWVMSADMIETNDGKLVCEPMVTAPSRFRGRISYGAYNPHIDSFHKQADDEIQRQLSGKDIDDTAIDADEMAQQLGKHKRKQSSSQGMSIKRPKRK